MTGKIIDSHAHLTSESCYSEIDAMLKEAEDAGIGAIINICTDRSSLQKALALLKDHGKTKLFTVAATTPHDVEKEGETFFPIVKQAAENNELVAIGETGLDYYYTHSPKEIQKIFLRRYLQLSAELNLPVVIHCRDAFSDFFEILDMENRSLSKPIRGVLHCFTGTEKEAQGVIDRGFYLSISGIVTYPKSQELQQVAKKISLDRLLVETDTPYLAPQKYRGKQNRPSYIVETIKEIATLKNNTFEEIVSATSKNAEDLFGLESKMKR